MYDRFLGKVCTLFINNSGFPFKDGIQYSEYMTGRVEEVDRSGILLKHLKNGTLSYFTFPINGIVEEQFIPENDPRAKEIKDSLKKSAQPEKSCCSSQSPKGSSSFIPVESLTKLVRDSKKT